MQEEAMTQTTKLDSGQKNLLRLALKGADGEGWAKVSKMIWPLIAKIPDDLLEKKPAEEGGHVRLTARGEAIILYT